VVHSRAAWHRVLTNLISVFVLYHQIKTVPVTPLQGCQHIETAIYFREYWN